ncbi:MAG: hypothetical protein KJ950_12610 [Proteobacteria bacterium]|nr:hypothetical protein [Pseudomonadota bacterium]MBU1687113.1 hypothetical protein [Pseudomonadota bacterium]
MGILATATTKNRDGIIFHSIFGAGKWKEATGFGLANNLLNQKDMECATVAAMPDRSPSEKQSILPRGHFVQYPLEGYKSHLCRRAARLGDNLLNLLKRLKLEGRS